MKNKNYYEYVLIENRPITEGRGLEFCSLIENLDQKSELWETECPYSFRYGRVVKTSDREEW
jgi:hypothetical protein